MAQIKRIDIYEGGNPFQDVNKALIELIELEKTLVDNNKVLQAQFSKITLSGSGKETAELVKMIESLRAEIDKLKATKETLTALEKAEKKVKQDLIDVQSAEYKGLQGLRAELNEQKKTINEQIKSEKALETQIDKQYESIADLQKINSDLNRQRRELNVTTKDGKKRYIELTQAIKKNEDTLKDFDKEIGRHQRNVGNYWESIKGGGSALSGWADGIGVVFSAFSKLNQITSENNKITQKLRQTLKPANDELESQLILVKQIAESYDEDYNQIIESANALTKQMGISGNDALNLINRGLELGANNTGEFFEMLREYPTFFKEAGLSADESIALISQSIESGIYSDKGVDAIKEATIRLREMTPTTKAALEGIKINSDELQKSINNGTKTYFEAIQEISGKLKLFQDDATKTGAVMADVFGGAGEDAGYQYLLSLENINLELDKLESNATEATTASNNLTDAWVKLTTQATSGEGVIGRFVTNAKQFAADLLTGITNLSKYGARSIEITNSLLESNKGNFNATFSGLQKRINSSLRSTADGAEKNVEIYKNSMRFLVDNVKDLGVELDLEQQSTLSRLGITQMTGRKVENAVTNKVENAVTNKVENTVTNKVKNEVTATKTDVSKQEEQDYSMRKQSNIDFLETKKENTILTNGEIAISEQNLTKVYENELLKRKEAEQLAAEERIELQKKLEEQIFDITQGFSADLAKLLVDKQTGAIDSQKEFNKQLAMLALNALKVTLFAALAETTLKQLSTKGFAGIATAAALNFIIAGAFNVAEAAINSNMTKLADGGEVKGAGTETSDSVPAMLSNGEFVVKASAYKRNKGLVKSINDGLITDNNMQQINIIENLQSEKYLKAIANNTANAGYTYVKDGFVHVISANGSTKKIKL